MSALRGCVALLAQVLDCRKTGHGALAHGNGHLERAPGAVARGKESGDSCLEIGTEHGVRPVEGGAGLARKVGSASATQCDTLPVEGFFHAVLVADAMERAIADKFGEQAFLHGHRIGERRGRGIPVRQQRY